ncbi:MAG: glycosyltransferase, partial [bacterium]
PEDFYLIVSRLEPYKKVDLAVQAFNTNGQKLVIIGEGSQSAHLQKIAKGNITFLGWQSNEAIYEKLSQAKALIFPGEDDFGITPVEAMAVGTPVIAYAKGGTLETVIEGKTGTFFDSESTDSLNQTISSFEQNVAQFDTENCKKQARNFSKEIFVKKLISIVETEFKNFKTKMGQQ